MTTNANSIFHFVRGAVRGSYGVEDFRGRRILIIGMDVVGQQLLTLFCMDGVKLFFLDNSLVNYDKAHMVCPQVRPFGEQQIEIIINLSGGFVSVNHKPFTISEIEDRDSYNQGIHAYYL